MSQIYKQGSGTPPPSTEVTFVTDDGTVISMSDIINYNGVFSGENDDNGILTRANPDTSNNMLVVITNRVQGTTQTVGAVTSAIITFTPTVIGTYAFEVRIAAHNNTSALGAAYSVFGSARFDGGNSILIDIPDKIVNEEGTMADPSGANVSFSVSGADILVNGIGYAGQTINWGAVGLYTFIGV